MAHRQNVNDYDTAFRFEGKWGFWYPSEGSATKAYWANRRRDNLLSFALPIVSALIVAVGAVTAILVFSDFRGFVRISIFALLCAVLTWVAATRTIYKHVPVAVFGGIADQSNGKVIKLSERVALRLTQEDRERLRAAAEEGISKEAVAFLVTEASAADRESSQPEKELRARTLMRGTPSARSR